MSGMFDLTDRVAVVTGAGQGLGESFARSLAEAGAQVFLAARNRERLLAAAAKIAAETGAQIYTCPLDITDEQSVMDACRFVLETAGRLEILVNNAAVGRGNQPLENESLEEWQAVLNTNLTGTFLMMKHAGRIMIQQKYGKIINLASMTGLVAMRNPSIGAYDVSKAGVECLTRLMAGEWAKYNINVNSICPGYYMTDLNKAYVEQNPEFYVDSLRQIPLGRWGEPKDIGDIAVFLASAASDYMTGANLVTDGGYTIW